MTSELTRHSTIGPAPTLTWWWRRGDALVAQLGSVVVVRWVGVPTVEQLDALADAHDAACRRPEDVVLVDHVLRIEGSVRVEAGLYDRLCRLVETGRARTSAVAHVIEVPGAIGAVVRGFLRGVEHVAGDGRTRTATFDGVDPALAWLLATAPSESRSRELSSVRRALSLADAPSLAA